MPEKRTIERAKQDKQRGKAPTTQAGEFVREEMHHIREGKHGARSAKQAIAIGLSKARRSGVDLPPPPPGKVSERSRKSAEQAYEVGQGERPPRAPSGKRSQAIKGVLKREGKSAASPQALSKQARSAAGERAPGERSAAAKRASQTKGPRERQQAAEKAARTKGHAGRSTAARKAARTRAAES
ncbi:MAG TPA: DUF6496 domain-containing protein [Tepidisphaeraceae bacterium]|nr:DUF6496 domain-containing protein [Tepidisphaeraceae bacterium]